MKRTFARCSLIGIVLAAGCASMFVGGGRLVEPGYKPVILVSYKSEGDTPSGVTYLLVQGPNGEAVMEQAEDGSGALFETRWMVDAADHYAGWVRTGPAWEFVVPKDRSLPASRYVYPVGTYELREFGGATRPVPRIKFDPATRLVPQSY